MTSPAVAFNATLGVNVVYAASAGSPAAVDAINATTGHKIWTVALAAPVYSSPAVVGNTVYFGGLDNILYALDATTGASICTYTGTGKFIASPVVANVDGTGPVVFLGDVGSSEQSNAGHEWAINGVGNSAGQCTLRWVFSGWLKRGPAASRTGSWSPPTLTTDSTGRPLLVFGSSNPDDAVYALDARTGSEVWRFQTLVSGGDTDVGAGAAVTPPGVNGFADGVVYINGKDRIEYAIDLLTGAQLWSFDMGADAGVIVNSISTGAVHDGLVVVSYAYYVYALNAVTGAKVWRSAAAAGIAVSSPAVSGAVEDEVVFSGDLAGVEHAYRLSDGAELLRVSSRNSGKIQSSAAVSSGEVFFGCSDGRIYAVG